MKRQIAYFIVIVIGFLALMGHFINYSPLNNFIDNFISHNDREVIQMRLSERKLFADGAKNPFMVDNDYSRDVENASKYIKFGKK